MTKVRLEPPIGQGFTSSSHIPAPPEKPTIKDYQVIWDSFIGNNLIEIPWTLVTSFESSGNNQLNAVRVSVVSGSATNTIRLSKVTNGTTEEGIYETKELSSQIRDLPNPLRLKMKVQKRQVIVNPGLWITRDQRYQEKHTNLMFIAADRNLIDSTLQEAQDHIENQMKIRTESISVLGLNIPSELLLIGEWLS